MQSVVNLSTYVQVCVHVFVHTFVYTHLCASTDAHTATRAPGKLVANPLPAYLLAPQHKCLCPGSQNSCRWNASALIRVIQTLGPGPWDTNPSTSLSHLKHQQSNSSLSSGMDAEMDGVERVVYRAASGPQLRQRRGPWATLLFAVWHVWGASGVPSAAASSLLMLFCLRSCSFHP